MYVGHTPVQKLNDKKEWGKVIVLDGNAKKGGKPFSAVPKKPFSINLLSALLYLVGIAISVHFGPTLPVVKNNCNIIVHDDVLETHQTLGDAKYCIYNSNNELKNLVLGSTRNVLIVAHGKEIAGISIFGSKLSFTTYKEVKEWREQINNQIGIATCRASSVGKPLYRERPIKEDGIFVFAKRGESVNGQPIDFFDSFEKHLQMYIE